MTTKVINLFGSPGTGKSTVAADLFAKLKWNNINCELVTEYAKELSWDGRLDFLSENQFYVSAQQNKRISRLIGKVDYVITDSPLILGLVYFNNDKFKDLANLLKSLYNEYENINVLLKRTKPYHKVGRSQSEEESKLLAHSIRNMLINNDQQFVTIDANEEAKNEIYTHIFGEL